MVCPLIVMIKVFLVLISSPTSDAMVRPPSQTQDQLAPVAPADGGDNIIKMIFKSSALLCPGK